MSKEVLIRNEYGEEVPYTVENGISLLLNGSRERELFYSHRSGTVPIIDTNPTDVAYYNTAQVVDNNLISTNIKANTSILGVSGDSNVVDTSDATATAEDIASGTTAYVQGTKVTGIGRMGGGDLEYIQIIGNNLTLTVNTPQWNGELEYSVDGETWATWSGTAIKSAAAIYLRGIENTTITDNNADGMFSLSATSKIVILGNIENLLDYDTVSSGQHPVMADGAFAYLFQGCDQLSIAPELQSRTLSEYCYANMFEYCTSLLRMPNLPATTLAEGCYAYMFHGCEKLLEVTELPATTLAEKCYQYMFSDCLLLETVPNLPAIILAPYCYRGMFQRCRMLQNLCTIAALELEEECCKYMFDGCSGIMLSTTQTGLYTQSYRVPISGIGIDATDALDSMFSNTGGTFTGTPEINTTYYWYCKYTELNPGYLTFSSALNTTIGMQMSNIAGGSKTWNGFVEYNIDASNDWLEWNGEYISGQIIKLRGTNNTHFNTSTTVGNGFQLTGSQIQIKGYIDTLLDYKSTIQGLTPTMDAYAFSGLFYNCTNLITAPIFKRRALSNYCYYKMFQQCTALTIMPELPALTLNTYCYSYMFASSGITTALSLPAVTLSSYCYDHMFYNCQSLVTAPILNATIMQDHCYYSMFQSCALTAMPDLPAVTLASYCYGYMFYQCSQLTSTTELSAVTLSSNCYYYMFGFCSALLQAPKIEAINLASYCCAYMFTSCTSLAVAPDLFAGIIGDHSYYYMFSNCIALEHMPIVDAYSIGSYGCAYMFNGCTGLKTVTPFSMVIFNTYCFQGMFFGCTSLEQLPEIDFRSAIPNYACNRMFYGCSKIKLSSTLTGSYTNPYRLPPFGSSSSTGSNAFYETLTNTQGTFKSTMARNTTYYTSNTVIPSTAYTKIGVTLTSELTVPLYFTRAGSNIFIDWGDSSSITTGSSDTTASHTYSSSGVYYIRIKAVTSGTNWIVGRYIDSKYYTLFHVIDTSGDESEMFKKVDTPYVTFLQLGRDCRLYDSSYSAYLYGNLAGLTNLTGTIDVPNSMTYIPEMAFLNCYNISKIILHSGIYRIDAGAFVNCSNLEEVEFPNTITHMGNRTVNGSGTNITTISNSFFGGDTELKKFIWPKGITLNSGNTSIGWGLNEKPNLAQVSIKSNLPIVTGMFQNCTSLANIDFLTTTIGSNAFDGCLALTSITIPQMTTSINDSAFLDCPSLNTFIVDLDNNNFSSESGILYNKNKTTLIRYPQSRTGTAELIDTLTDIGNYAFANNLLTSCILPNSLINLGTMAFYKCSNLSSINIPNNVTTINNGCFLECSSLTSITIPNSVITLDANSFRDCTSLVSITLSNNLTTISSSCFYNCTSLLSINIPNGVTTIEGNAFYGCASLNSISIPNTVTTINNYCFAGCAALTSIIIPNSVTSLGSYNFSGCSSLTSITLSSNITILATSLFKDCTSLTNFVIPINITTLQESVFSGTHISTIHIHNNITSIANTAFSGCSDLATFTIDSSNTNYAVNDGVLYNKTLNMLIWCPQQKEHLILPNTVTTIGNRVTFNYITSITISDVLSESVITQSLYGYNLENIYVNSTNTNYTSINGVLYNSSETIIKRYPSHSNASLINTVTTIGSYAFSHSLFTTFTVPNGVTTIESSGFQNCENLISIILPDTLTSMGMDTFYQDSALMSITCYALTPPTITSSTFFNVPNTCQIYVPAAAVEDYKAASYWSNRASYIQAIPV